MRMAEILHRLGYISRNHAVAVTRTISSGSTSGTPRRRPRRCSSAPSSALLGTRNRGRNPLSLDPEHREFEAKKEFGAACRDRRNQRRNKALLAAIGGRFDGPGFATQQGTSRRGPSALLGRHCASLGSGADGPASRGQQGRVSATARRFWFAREERPR